MIGESDGRWRAAKIALIYDASDEQRGFKMALGQVKWFNRAKGFGIITQGDGDDVFVHYSQCLRGAEQILEAGDEVEFELKQSYGDLHAVNVHRCLHSDANEKKRRPQMGRR